MRDRQRIFGAGYAAAQDGIDVDLKFRVLGEQLQLLIEHFEALLGYFVRRHVVYADLKILKPGPVKGFNAGRNQEIPIGDEARHNTVFSYARDDAVEFRVQQRLTAADGYDRGAHGAQAVDSLEHLIGGNWLRKIIEFVAIRAGEIAATDRDDVHEQGMFRGGKSLDDHAPLTHLAMCGQQPASNFLLSRHDVE